MFIADMKYDVLALIGKCDLHVYFLVEVFMKFFNKNTNYMVKYFYLMDTKSYKQLNSNFFFLVISIIYNFL